MKYSLLRVSFYTMAIRSLLCLLILVRLSAVYGQLYPRFYDISCPSALSIVNSVVTQAVAKEKRMGASLLRLHFHDCFVNGCDGSILLDDTSTFQGEKTAVPNKNSVRGFEVIDAIKTQVEAACPGVVSCADIVAIAARDAVVQLGGPTWLVLLGRRDSTTASLSAANTDIPPPASNLTALISSFQSHGLSIRDLVALSGSHTIGQARCTNFRNRIHSESNIDLSFARARQANCPSTGGDDSLAPLDLLTPTTFDNNYYKNLERRRGLLHSDQQLFNGGSTDNLVSFYTTYPIAFSIDFAVAMVKMGSIEPLTGNNGEIRKNCRKIN